MERYIDTWVGRKREGRVRGVERVQKAVHREEEGEREREGRGRGVERVLKAGAPNCDAPPLTTGAKRW